MHRCFSSFRYSVLITGTACGHSAGKRGLRKGDSLFPVLFRVVADALSSLISRGIITIFKWFKSWKDNVDVLDLSCCGHECYSEFRKRDSLLSINFWGW